MEQGVVYDNAHYQHSTTFTAVGHATLPVAPEDIAITIATYLGTKPPSGSVGEMLYEALPAGPRIVQGSSQ